MSMSLALAAMVAPAAPPAADAQPIVVIGKRLEAWRGRLTKARGTYRCKTLRSTGDKAIDAIGCTALATCIAPVQPAMDAIIAAKQPRADRQRRLQATLEAQMPCLTSTRDDLVRKLADARAAA